MWYQRFADLVLLCHLVFILFVLLGSVLGLRWRWMFYFHLPAVLWAASLEFGGWMCPLTLLENSLRQASGEVGYSGGFLEHYLVPVIYPASLTPSIQWHLGLFVILLNLGLYSFVYARKVNVV